MGLVYKSLWFIRHNLAILHLVSNYQKIILSTLPLASYDIIMMYGLFMIYVMIYSYEIMIYFIRNTSPSKFLSALGMLDVDKYILIFRFGIEFVRSFAIRVLVNSDCSFSVCNVTASLRGNLVGTSRPWHDAQAIACARSVIRTNQEKGGLGGPWKARPKVNLCWLISPASNAK